MFITSDSNPSAMKADSRCMTWPGPRLLLIKPQSRFSQLQKKNAQQSFFVFDFISDPISRFDALRAVIIRAAQGRVELRGALLYYEGTLSDDEFDRLRNATQKDIWFIEHATDPADGRLTLLVLGAGIVENPLFLTFFANLNPGISEECTGDCLAAIHEHLVWRKGATPS